MPTFWMFVSFTMKIILQKQLEWLLFNKSLCKGSLIRSYVLLKVLEICPRQRKMNTTNGRSSRHQVKMHGILHWWNLIHGTQGHTFRPNPSNDDQESVPNSNPKAIVFLKFGQWNYLYHHVLVVVKPCRFCQRLFEPTWYVKFVSYRHSYHFWCALSHFSTSTKCLFEMCGQEMYRNLWLLSRMKKPRVGEEAMLGNDKTTITLGLF